MNVKRTNVMVPREESDLIPAVLFDQIVKLMPIVSVDAVIVIDNSLLLLKRTKPTCQGAMVVCWRQNTQRRIARGSTR